MKTKNLVVLLVAVVIILSLILQNTHVVTVHFLFWEATMSHIIVLTLVLLLGVVIGYTGARWRERQRRRSGSV